MKNALAGLTFTFVLCTGAAFGQVQQLPQQTPQNQERLGEAFRRAQAEEAARVAEAERQRLEELANRVLHYMVTCRVSQIIVRQEQLVISCHDIRNTQRSDGAGPYTGNSYGSSNTSVYVNYGPNPAFATLAGEIASVSYAAESRLRMEFHRNPGDRTNWLTQITIDRGEGCAPRCPP